MNSQTIAMLYNINAYKHIVEHLIAPQHQSCYEKMPDCSDYKEYDCEYDDSDSDSECPELNFND